MKSEIFKSGNSLAVRIPKELAFDGGVQEVDIVRMGNGLWVQPRRLKKQAQTLAGLGDIFAMFSPDFMADGREGLEQAERKRGSESGGRDVA
jgi:antitoxin VapB